MSAELTSHFHTAFDLELRGEYEQAIPLYAAVAEDRVAPHRLTANATYRLGLCLEAAGRVIDALRHYESCAMSTPDPMFRALGCFHMAAALNRESRFSEAFDWIERGLSVGYDGVPSPFTFLLKKAVCQVRSGQHFTHPEPHPAQLDPLEAAGWMELGRELEQSGNMDAARDCYQSLVGIQGLAPDVASAAQQRLQVLANPQTARLALLLQDLNQRRPEAALQELQRLQAPELVQDSPLSGIRLQLWFARVVALALLNRVEAPATDLAVALPGDSTRTDEGTCSLWMLAGFSLENAGQLPAAGLFYGRLLEQPQIPGSMFTNAHYRLGIVRDRLMDWHGAIEHYQAAINSSHIFPAAQADARWRLAEIYMAQEEFLSAAAEYEILRALSALGPHQRLLAQVRLATCMMRLGKDELAESELKKCRLPEGGSGTEVEVKADILLGELYERRKDKALARDSYQRVVKNSAAEPNTRAAALHKLRRLR